MPQTPRTDFLENAPLYTQYEVAEFYPPESISRECDRCSKETTWNRENNVHELYGIAEMSGYTCNYKCALCTRQRVTFIVRVATHKSKTNSIATVHKIGQFPPQSIAVPAELSQRLGNDVALYKNALVCRNANFGVAALAYLRRVVENKTNELIEVVAQQAESLAADPQDVAKIRAAKDEKISFDERLMLASHAVPAKLVFDGANPLDALYGMLSNGMHARSEDECIAIADEIRDVFEYVFSRLRAEIEDRKTISSKIKKWVSGRGATDKAKEEPQKEQST